MSRPPPGDTEPRNPPFAPPPSSANKASSISRHSQSQHNITGKGDPGGLKAGHQSESSLPKAGGSAQKDKDKGKGKQPAGGKDSGSTSHEKPDGSSLWQQFKLDSLKESFKQRTSRGRSGISSLFSRNRQSESDESHVTPPYVAADQDFENNEEKEDTLPQTLKQPHYVQDIEYLKPFASNHFGGENVVSVMYRLAHLAKIRLLRRMRTELMTDNAMAIPDIMLNGGAAFHTAWTTVATGDVLGDVFGAEHASGSKRPRTLELQLVAMATRAAIVNAIFDRIVYMAQRKRLGNHKRFAAAGDFNRMPSLPEGLAGQLNFTERADSIHYASSAANATAAYSAGGGSGDPATTLDAILICGPRQTGKSHVMFHLAARMAAEQRVGVVYVGNGADLLLDGSDADRAKYARFVEHVAAAFSEYAQINEMVQTWYKATGIGTDLRELRERTTELLAEVRRLCEKEPGGITPVFFIDAFEAMADAQVFGTIVTPRELTHVHGAVVVLSAGDMGDHQNALKRMALSTCTVAVALSEHDAANVVVATHGQLRMTRAVLRRLHDAAGSHMLDFVRLLDECAAGDEGAHVTAAAAQRAIDAYEVRRTLRLTDMHARFVRRRLDTALDGMPRSQIEFAGAAGKEVAMTTPGLATERRSVMRTPFMLYHNLALKPGAVLDAQFLIEDAAVPAAAAAAAAAGDDDGAAARAHSSLHVTCHPPAAVAAMYRLHFGGGPVLRQFAWLLSDARYKFEVDAPVRARLFDLLLLETQRLAAQATHPLTHQVWPVALNFDAATAHDHRRWGVARSPATCATFDDTVRLVADHIRATRARRPPHVPVAMTVAEMRTTLVVYLPCLNFSTWPDRAIAIDKCFPGAFMLAITRVDLRGRAADECVYELTWIASDPLCAVGSDELISVVTASDAAAGHGKVVAAQPSQQAQAQAQDEAAADILDSYRSPRDTQNYDQLYGVAQSWSAKAIRIFPALRDMCLAALPSDVLRHVRMLALADANRATAIVDEAQLVRLEPRLAAFSTEGSQDIGLIKTNALSAVHQQISAYI